MWPKNKDWRDVQPIHTDSKDWKWHFKFYVSNHRHDCDQRSGPEIRQRECSPRDLYCTKKTLPGTPLRDGSHATLAHVSFMSSTANDGGSGAVHTQTHHISNHNKEKLTLKVSTMYGKINWNVSHKNEHRNASRCMYEWQMLLQCHAPLRVYSATADRLSISPHTSTHTGTIWFLTLFANTIDQEHQSWVHLSW